jgi:hypothetical protein
VLAVLSGFMLRLHSPELRTHLADAKHFSRRRKLDFTTLICWFIGGQRAAVQTGLDHFFAVVQNQADLVRRVSAQALSKARRHLPVAVFNDLSQHLLGLVRQHVGIPLWHGLRVVAADGSSVRLTIQDVTRRIRFAQVFGLYLPGVEMMLHATLYSSDTGERQMLFEHLDQLCRDDLLVMDRGYPASWLMAALISRGLNFCMRIDATGSAAVKAFIRGQAPEAVVELPAPNAQDALDYGLACEPVKVRLIRIITPDGLIRVLATNLLDTQLWPAADFGALYHQRWRIEEAFRRLKHRLSLEAVSGLSWLTHQQDLAAKILSDNLNAVLCHAALNGREGHIDNDAPTIVTTPTGSSIKLNRTRAFAHIAQCLPRWLTLNVSPTLAALSDLLHRLASNVIHFVPDRSRPRRSQPKPHKAFSAKSVM